MNKKITILLWSFSIITYCSEAPPLPAQEDLLGRVNLDGLSLQEEQPNLPAKQQPVQYKASDFMDAVKVETPEHSKLLTQLAKKNPAALAKIKTADGSNLLMMAAYSGCPSYVKFLLNHININNINNKGHSALSLACLKGHNDIVQELTPLSNPMLFPAALEFATHAENLDAVNTLLQYPYYETEHIVNAARIIKERYNGTHQINPLYKALDQQFQKLNQEKIAQIKKEKLLEAQNQERERRQQQAILQDARKNKLHYESILELSGKYNLEELKQAYKLKALKFHPDKTGGDDTMFKSIQDAYEKLATLLS